MAPVEGPDRLVDGREVFTGASAGTPSVAEVHFSRRSSGEARIVIQARDAEGAFLVRWLPGEK